MEQLPRIQSRISSLQELRDIVRALRALAASHVQEAQRTLVGVRKYVEVVEDAIAQGASLIPETAEELTTDKLPHGSVLIVVCSEHGFAGAFNERLLDRATEERTDGQELVVIGSRGAMLVAEKGLSIGRTFPMATNVGGVLGVTRLVAEYLAGVSKADVVFGSYRRGGNFDVEFKSIIPLDPALLVGSGRRSPPLHHLAPDTLLRHLSSEYLFAEITRVVMESLASENGARLRVMETADQNIGDKLEVLHRSANAMRQEVITSELLDVITGSEAILNSANR